MATLSVFNFMTLNGFTHDAQGGIAWHRHGEEEGAYAAEGANSASILVFGRRTYDMMASFWPTPMAAQMQPEVAKGMNASSKIVFSRTMKNAAWENTRLVASDPAAELRRLKSEQPHPLTILGSGSIVSLAAEHGLIDDYKLMIDPVLLGAGSTLAAGISSALNLQLKDHRVFRSGVVLLHYVPAS